jgi:cytochrome bd-type quinol oxidase subunit 2
VIDEFKREWTVNDKKEAIWFAVVSIVALLVLIILHQTGEIVGARTGAEVANIPSVYWMLVVVCLSLCVLVPYLLKDSKSMEFKVIAIILTALAPTVVVGFALFSLWRSASPQ